MSPLACPPRLFAATVVLALLSAAAVPALAAQTLLPAQSEIAFTTRQMGVPVEGRFRKFDAQVTFDPKKLDAARIAFNIDLGSTTIGTAETEAELAKPDWFNVKLFPQASFQSSSVKALGGGRFEVAGTLVIKGAKQNLVVPVSVTQTGGTSTATGAFGVKRLDFKVGDGDWKDTSMVANEVQVRFKLALSGIPAL